MKKRNTDNLHSRVFSTERPLWEIRHFNQAILALMSVSHDQLNGEEDERDDSVRTLACMCMDRVRFVENALDHRQWPDSAWSGHDDREKGANHENDL
jgi:hypothetical protein